MADRKTTRKTSAPGKIRLRQYPSKTTINLAAVGKKPINFRIGVPVMIIVIAIALLFSKFLVIDRLAEVAAAQNKVSSLQSQLNAAYEELAGFEDLNELYAHYTYSGFTAEEMTRTSRLDVLRLIRRVVIPDADLSAWSLSGNELTLTIRGNNLQEINLLSQKLQDDPLVNYCTVSTANTQEVRDDGSLYDTVSARILVYLNSVAEE